MKIDESSKLSEHDLGRSLDFLSGQLYSNWPIKLSVTVSTLTF